MYSQIFCPLYSPQYERLGAGSEPNGHVRLVPRRHVPLLQPAGAVREMGDGKEARNLSARREERPGTVAEADPRDARAKGRGSIEGTGLDGAKAEAVEFSCCMIVWYIRISRENT